MKKVLTHNLGLKFLSVVLAVFTWLIMVNVSNPLLTRTVTVPVEFTNVEVLTTGGLTYESVGRNTVTVSYKIHVRDESRITASDFYAFADLSQLYDVTGSIPVQVELSTYLGRSLVSAGSVTVSPPAVRIQTEPIQTKSFMLEIHELSGSAADGYAIGDVKLMPARVTATGAESVIGQINSVGVEISVEGADTDLTGSASVYLYDANGNHLNLADEVKLNSKQVDYTVSVLRVKDLAVDYQVSGVVADGYRFTGVDSDIRSISVEGLRSALANLTTLVVSGETLDISGATQDVEVTVDLEDFLPDNITIAGSETTANVVLHIEPLETRQLRYETDRITMEGAREDYEYVIMSDVVMLRVRGLSEDLDMLEAGNMEITMDVSGLARGTHQVLLHVDLEEGFDYMGPDTLLVHVRDLAAEAEATVEETAEETEE